MFVVNWQQRSSFIFFNWLFNIHRLLQQLYSLYPLFSPMVFPVCFLWPMCRWWDRHPKENRRVSRGTLGIILWGLFKSSPFLGWNSEARHRVILQVLFVLLSRINLPPCLWVTAVIFPSLEAKLSCSFEKCLLPGYCNRCYYTVQLCDDIRWVYSNTKTCGNSQICKHTEPESTSNTAF